MPDNILAPLLIHGPLGVFCVILLWACRALFIKYEQSQQKRIDEGLKNTERLHEAIATLRNLRGRQ